MSKILGQLIVKKSHPILQDGFLGVLKLKKLEREAVMSLELKNITKQYGSQIVVNHQSFVFENGVYGLLGVNGAGKTTLMNMICTLTSPSEGRICYKGNNIQEMGEEYRSKLGYLPQDFGYYPDLTVWDYLFSVSLMKGLQVSEATKRIGELLEQVGMNEKRNVKMRKLSGGMLRRVGIAQALLNNPKILILDEPTAGLDPSERIRFRNIISEIAMDKIVILSTHIVSDIEFIAKQIVLMNKGEFCLTGTLEEILSSVDTQVWTCKISNIELEKYLTQYLVANVKTIVNGVEVRILSDTCPIPGAVQEQLTLEDAFLYYFGREVRNAHADIL